MFTAEIRDEDLGFRREYDVGGEPGRASVESSMQAILLVPLSPSRRHFLAGVAAIGLTGWLGASAWSGPENLPLSFPRQRRRNLVRTFPQKG